jgi:hypothetical protein
MSFLAQIIVWLNALANAVGQIVLAPVAYLPGWLSATLIAAVTGVLLLVMFKYTSNQKAIKRVRDDIKANLLALKLFKDSAVVALRAQGRILVGAFWLMIYAIVPMLVMMAPVLLILGQLSLWYQARPLQVGEEAVVTLKLQGDPASALPEVRLQPTDAVQVTVGPVRVRSQREVCWNLQAAKEGKERLVFRVGDQTFDKELAVGGGFMRVSPLRPGWHWSDVLLNPAEPPFAPESPVQSIEITYPERPSWTSGSNYWVIYWFIVSMVAALCFRKAFNVNI